MASITINGKIYQRAVPQSRVTVNDNLPQGYARTATILPPSTPESDWRLYELDTQTLGRISVQRLSQLLADLSPEVSRALWDFLRFCNPGWTLKAYRPGSRDQHAQAEALLKGFMGELEDLYGAPDVVFGRLFMAAFLRGAFLSEVVLESGRVPVDLVTPDPWGVRFRTRQDPVRGEVWTLGQYQGSEWVPLDWDTIGYVPIDPFPDSPYGRPPAAPSLFSALFLLGLLHDLRRVVAQQGYPRLDIAISMEKLLDMMPENVDDDAAVEKWVAAQIEEIEKFYADLEPDQAYVHADFITVNRSPVGTLGADALSAVDALVRALERMATRALKSMPLLMGSNESTTETNAIRQWEIHTAGIRSLQHGAETLLSRLLRVALEAQGVQADVELRFAELRASEDMRDAQSEALRIGNARQKYDNGWISQDQAAEEVTGHEADEPEPRSNPGGVQFLPGAGTGEGRVEMVPLGSLRAETVVPEGADEPLPPLPTSVELDDGDLLEAMAVWDELMEERYAGLFDAEPVADASEAEGSGRSGWFWLMGAFAFLNTETGENVPRGVAAGLQDRLREEMGGLTDTLAGELAQGNISLQRWTNAMRRNIRYAHADQYMLARGGRLMMDLDDYTRLGRVIQGQYGWLRNFGEDIAAGNLTEGQIRARARMYMDSAGSSFQRGVVAGYGMPDLPQYPRDGSTQCLTSCRCTWIIRETEDAWECTWDVDEQAENCVDCLYNGRRWAPLVIPKTEARTLGEVEERLHKIEDEEAHRHD